MKKLIVLSILLTSVSLVSAQLVITTKLHPTAKGSILCVPHYFYVAEGRYTNTSLVISNNWYYPTNPVITATFTNLNYVINISSQGGGSACGKGSVSYTNPVYPQDVFKFFLFMSNNVANPPTNGELVPIQVTGVRTNAP